MNLRDISDKELHRRMEALTQQIELAEDPKDFEMLDARLAELIKEADWRKEHKPPLVVIKARLGRVLPKGRTLGRKD